MFKVEFTPMTLFLGVWFVLTLVLFGVLGWNHIQNAVYTSAYQDGVKRGASEASAQIYTDIINKSANEACNTVYIQYDNRRVDLVNVQCLNVAPASEEAPQVETDDGTANQG